MRCRVAVDVALVAHGYYYIDVGGGCIVVSQAVGTIATALLLCRSNASSTRWLDARWFPDLLTCTSSRDLDTIVDSTVPVV